MMALSLNIISTAASVGFFQAVAFRKTRTVAVTGFSHGAEAGKCKFHFPRLGTPSCKAGLYNMLFSLGLHQPLGQVSHVNVRKITLVK